MILISIVFIIFALCISSYLTQRIIAPIHNMDDTIYEELLPFIKKIKIQQGEIENQRAELAKKTSEFNVITEDIGDGLVLLNSQSQVITMNKKAESILGNKKKAYTNIVDYNRTIELQEALKTAYKGHNIEVNIMIKNRLFLFHIAPVYHEKSLQGVVILIVDNTKKHEVETLRREFSANVSHELKTPLTSISGYAELMMEGLVKPEDIQPFAQNIYDETHRLISLVEDIIKLSKLDEGGGKIVFAPVSLLDSITSVVARLEPLASKKDIVIQMELEPIVMLGVAQILNEVFYNIIANAIKYNVDKGQIHIKLYQTAISVVIEIKDTGIGIPDENIDRIFERFYRVDTSHSKDISGTGLGLSIVKHGVNLHKGQIMVESKWQEGTEFKIRFPVES